MVLLSFAQFEREVTGERIRDKIAASKKKGMWMGGMPPLGYDVKNRKLAVNDAEACIVVEIYRRYLALKSVHALREELADAGIKSLLCEYPGQRLTVTVVPTGYLWRETACASLLQFRPPILEHIAAIKTKLGTEP